MEEKRYFCDFYAYCLGRGSTLAFFKKELLIFFSSLILITFIGYLISYNVIMSNHEYELNLYSAETYEHLDEIANNVIKEGAGIDLSALPDDVEKYEITSENDEIIFKYYLNNYKDVKFAIPVDVTVKLSNDFNVISKEPNYSSKEDYIKGIKKGIKFNIGVFSLLTGFLVWGITEIVSFVVLTICAFVSKSRKKKNLS